MRRKEERVDALLNLSSFTEDDTTLDEADLLEPATVDASWQSKITSSDLNVKEEEIQRLKQENEILRKGLTTTGLS